MAAISKNLVKKVRELYYDKQFSVNDVANKLGVSIDAVFYCMRKNGIKRRKKHESNAIRYERQKPSFKLKKINSEKLKILKVVGVMLYWA